MPIKIVGCPDKNFTPYVHRAAKYYANCLMTKKMQENTRIIIKFSDDLKDCGYAYVAGKNSRGRPRKFFIDVHTGLGARGILEDRKSTRLNSSH